MRGPDTLRGGLEGSLIAGTDGRGRNVELQESANTQICAYFLSQELAALKQNPVENFGAAEARI
jgi:hypothetical protein